MWGIADRPLGSSLSRRDELAGWGYAIKRSVELARDRHLHIGVVPLRVEKIAHASLLRVGKREASR